MSAEMRTRLGSPAVMAALVAVSVLWSVPTLGLVVISLRPPTLAQSSGWWTFLAHPGLTLDNYRAVLTNGGLGPDGALSYVRNTVLIAVPSVVLPLALGCMAAYALAWIDFRGSTGVLLGIIGLLVIPVQMTLLPLARLFAQGWSVGPLPLIPAMGLGSSYLPLWVAHTLFALPLAILLMHGCMAAVPRDVVEAARIDGAGHLAILARIVIPLCSPAIAAFAVLQFIWVWNDLLVALAFAGTSPDVVPITPYLASTKAAHADQPARVAALACVAIVVPSLVLATAQRQFVRGVRAGTLGA